MRVLKKKMPKTTDYESRKRMVLAKTIERYIREAAPIASEDIAQEFDLSSATIRNIFKELEADGYLKHPYTSGGRIPTDKGYRYYVDLLICQLDLVDDVKELIGRQYRQVSNGLEDILEKTTDLLSAVTHYASIVSLFDEHNRFFYKGVSFILEQPEFQNSEQIRLLIRMLEDRQRLLDIINRDFKGKVIVYIGDESGCPEIGGCSLAVSSYSLRNRPIGRIAVLGPVRMQYTQIIPALEYVSDTLTLALSEI